MKKLEDYLYLYVGANIYIFPPDTVGQWIGEQMQRLPELNYSYPLTIDKIKSTLKDGYLPILRKLDSMTDDEVNAIASIMISKEQHCEIGRVGDDYISATYKKEPVTNWGDWDSVSMILSLMESSKGIAVHNNWDYSNNKGIGHTSEDLHNSHEITRFMLRQGFDVFGLINANLAVDKSAIERSIKEQVKNKPLENQIPI